MPHTYSISTRKRRAEIVPEGPSTLDDARQVMRQISEDPKFGPDFSILADVRGFEGDLSPDDIRSFVYSISEIPNLKSHRIAVVTDGPLYYGFGRMMSTTAQLAGLNMRAFRSLPKAERWLGGPAKEG